MTTISVSNPVRVEFDTLESESAVVELPPTSSQVATSVAPFQEAYAVRLPVEFSAKSGDVVGYPVHAILKAR